MPGDERDDVMGEGLPPAMMGEEGGMGAEQMEEEVPRINVEIPRCVAQLGTEQHFVKLPNFLSVETRYVQICVMHNRVLCSQRES